MLKKGKNNITNNDHFGEIIIYEGADGAPRIEVRVEGETVWLMQAQLAELFNTSRPNITMHIKNIFDEGELSEVSVCKDFLHTATDGKKVLTEAGSVSHAEALKKAEAEYKKFQAKTLSPVEKAYLENIKLLEKKVEKKIKDKK